MLDATLPSNINMHVTDSDLVFKKVAKLIDSARWACLFYYYYSELSIEWASLLYYYHCRSKENL